MTRCAAVLLLLLACTWPAAVRCSVDEFQCACGHDARRHLQTVSAALDAGDEHAATVAAAAYGALACRMLSVACGGRPPEPPARWLWLLDLYADRAHGPRLRESVDRVRGELDRYVAVCEARGQAEFARRWSRAEFEKYLLERTTAVRADAREDAADEASFQPARLYLDDVAAGGGAALAAVIMPPDVGIDWADAADWLARLYRAARRKGVLGTQELVLYQKKFVAAVTATAMAHVLVHVMYCQEYWREGGGGGGGGGGTGGGGDGAPGGGDSSNYVGEYERTWMSVGGLLDKFRAYLGLRGSEDHFRALVDVAGNPVRDADGFRAVKSAIRHRIADVGAGLFGPALTATVPTIVRSGASESGSELIDLIALVDNNIGAAEKYLTAVQGSLPGVHFRIINEFMSSAHIWLT